MRRRARTEQWRREEAPQVALVFVDERGDVRISEHTLAALTGRPQPDYPADEGARFSIGYTALAGYLRAAGYILAPDDAV